MLSEASLSRPYHFHPSQQRLKLLPSETSFLLPAVVDMNFVPDHRYFFPLSPLRSDHFGPAAWLAGHHHGHRKSRSERSVRFCVHVRTAAAVEEALISMVISAAFILQRGSLGAESAACFAEYHRCICFYRVLFFLSPLLKRVPIVFATAFVRTSLLCTRKKKKKRPENDD